MEYIVQGYEPKKLFEFFEEICAIPHGSGNESAIAEYLVDFANARGLECHRDAVNNVFIKAPATKGLEDRPAILLQGHTDMVCEKNHDTVHDFTKDGLKLFIEDGWLGAKGTTLGGDDGIAVAMMMAILDGQTPHPAVECLFTVEEEVGLLGAESFDYSLVSATRMINMDSEDEACVTAGCAGGLRTDLAIPVCYTEALGAAVKISIGGLAGGHSGADVHRGRANANKLMGRVLRSLSKELDFNLCAIEGGSKDNAIPRECVAVVCGQDLSNLSAKADKLKIALTAELCAQDAGFFLQCEEIKLPNTCMDQDSTKRVICAIATVASGVLAMSNHIEGLVEYSRNLGIIRTAEDCVHLTLSSRSAIESQLDASIDELDALAALCGASTRHHSRYPGWSYAKQSPIREEYLAAYAELFGKTPEVSVIHAGLECGIIRSRLPRMDMISVGPNMRDIHSPDERLDLASCARFWQVIAHVLCK
ncbi:MAG: aminoacyl-histidine dipeptidase [Clostridia bacterium]|nr:aminoacyl-histidine dipeptidase [Clostridia bacterium]